MMSDWNPDLYLKFQNERTQPAVDLASRISLRDVRSAVDVGCGPGNSTQVLRARWPRARIAGLDNSAEMIAKGRKDFPDQDWVLADAAAHVFGQRHDVVFSNAALQWIPDHETLIPRLWDAVNAAGALAVQVPANSDSPLHQAVVAVASQGAWGHGCAAAGADLNYGNAEFYYRLLCGHAARVDLWQTEYFHVLDSHQDLVAWYTSTGMRTFLDRLSGDEEKAAFEGEVLRRCVETYSVQGNGKILFPFKRLFFIAYRGSS